MNRYAASAIAVLFGSGILQSAVAQENPMSLGVQGGLNFSTFGGDLNFDSRTGFSVGAFAGYQLTDVWGFRVDVSYTQKGAKDESVTIPVVERDIEVSYLELQLPIVLKPRLATGNLQPRFYAGPYAAIKVGCSKTLDSATQEPTTSDCEEGTGAVQLESGDLGLTLGALVNLGGPSGGVLIGIRYDYGIANIKQAFPGAPPGDVKNRVFQVLAGYSYYW